MCHWDRQEKEGREKKYFADVALIMKIRAF